MKFNALQPGFGSGNGMSSADMVVKIQNKVRNIKLQYHYGGCFLCEKKWTTNIRSIQIRTIHAICVQNKRNIDSLDYVDQH